MEQGIKNRGHKMMKRFININEAYNGQLDAPLKQSTFQFSKLIDYTTIVLFFFVFVVTFEFSERFEK